jgi:hypothetical protein
MNLTDYINIMYTVVTARSVLCYFALPQSVESQCKPDNNRQSDQVSSAVASYGIVINKEILKFYSVLLIHFFFLVS